MRRIRYFADDTSWNLQHDRVRVAYLQRQLVAVEFGVVADTHDLQLLLEWRHDPSDHVVDQATRESVQCTILPAVIRTHDGDLLCVRIVFHGQIGVASELQITVGALDGYFRSIKLDLNLVRDLNWFFANT